MTPFTDKFKAIRAVQREGYTIECGVGESGDGGYGSRIYYRKPGSRLNGYGMPLEHAEVSKVGRAWFVSVFGSEEAKF